MLRKATNSETMNIGTLEQLYTAIQQRFEEQDKLIQQRFEEQDKKFDKMQATLLTVLNIVKSYDQERKEVKSTLWEYERRLLKLEKQSA